MILRRGGKNTQKNRLLWWSTGSDTELGMQEAWAPSLARELDPTCHQNPEQPDKELNTHTHTHRRTVQKWSYK